MNIGRTVRVFRAEPVMSPVAEAGITEEETPDTTAPVEVDATATAPAVRVGV
ncbi:hypothetical protein EV378_6692 [Pseudonocardia endophytica]|uniref:Uncharacterized protein n=1 Tax=Pseudonocardia endophytica TaxID=401976 RepID=A0A4R1HJX1_PSEEN|nr:hypothetical protein EV378_6692 [Pseudonocardia endophytica]